MKIQNKFKYRIKHIGYLLLVIGMLLIMLQIAGFSWAFPLDSIILFISFVFQMIGYKEPLWYLVDKEDGYTEGEEASYY